MFAIQNQKTGKFLYGTDYRYNPPRQRTSFNEIVSHILDGTLLSWLASWKMKSQMLVAFLLENEKAQLSEKD